MNQTIYFQRDVWAKLQAEEKKSALINSLLRKHYDVIEPLSKPSVTTQHKPAIPQPAEAPRVSADPYDTSMFDRGDVSPITKSHSARKKGAKWPTTNIKPDTTPVGPVASASPGNAGAMQESEPSSDTEEPTDEFKIPDEFDTDSLRAVKEKAAAAVRQSLARTDVTPIDKKYSARKRK